jgi:hypothetical protein
MIYYVVSQQTKKGTWLSKLAWTGQPQARVHSLHTSAFLHQLTRVQRQGANLEHSNQGSLVTRKTFSALFVVTLDLIPGGHKRLLDQLVCIDTLQFDFGHDTH